MRHHSHQELASAVQSKWEAVNLRLEVILLGYGTFHLLAQLKYLALLLLQAALVINHQQEVLHIKTYRKYRFSVLLIYGTDTESADATDKRYQDFRV